MEQQISPKNYGTVNIENIDPTNFDISLKEQSKASSNQTIQNIQQPHKPHIINCTLQDTQKIGNYPKFAIINNQTLRTGSITRGVDEFNGFTRSPTGSKEALNIDNFRSNPQNSLQIQALINNSSNIYAGSGSPYNSRSADSFALLAQKSAYRLPAIVQTKKISQKFEQKYVISKKKIFLLNEFEQKHDEALGKIRNREKAAELTKIQSAKIRIKIQQKSMTKLYLNQILEAEGQHKLEQKQLEKQVLEKHNNKLKQLTVNKLILGGEIIGLHDQQKLPIDQQSLDQYPNAAGQFISKLIKDQEDNPEKYFDPNEHNKAEKNYFISKQYQQKYKKTNRRKASSFIKMQDQIETANNVFQTQKKFIKAKRRNQKSNDYLSAIDAKARGLKGEEDVGSEGSKDTFHKMYPDFRTGITPIKLANDSDLNSTERKEYDLQREKQAKREMIFQQKDIELIQQRKSRFRNLMSANITAQAQVDQSQIIRENSTYSEQGFSDFPFLAQGKSDFLQAYKSPLKIGAPKEKLIAQHKINSKQQDFLSEDIKKASNSDTSQSCSFQHKQEALNESLQINQDDNNKELMNKFIEFVLDEKFPQNILQIQSKLEDNVLKKGFQNYQEIQDAQIATFVKHVNDKKNFFGQCKNATSPRNQELSGEDPNIVFYNYCKQNNIPVLSLLQKRSDKSLNIIGYNLNDGICCAIQGACKKFPELVNSLQLENNGLRDKGMSIILEGVLELKDLKRFVCKNNEMHYNSVCHLKKIIERKAPLHLEELCLSNCKLSAALTDELLQQLAADCQLRKLSLIKINIHNNSIDNLIGLIDQSAFLIDLDISWNELRPSSMYYLSECLAKNRRLQHVNLSWNNFKELERLQNFKTSESYVMDEDDKNIITNLCKFIKQNQRLIHLNMSHSGLSKAMMYELGPALRRAKSIISLHLSGNPGIDDELKDYLYNRIHCAPSFDQIYIHVFQKDNIARIQNGLAIASDKIKESIKMREFREQQYKVQDGRPDYQDDGNTKLAFQRILGHKKDIPGSGQWQQLLNESQKCWICQKSCYSLIFWSQNIGQFSKNQSGLQAVSQTVEKLAELLVRMKKLIDNDEYDKKNHRLAYNIELAEENSSPEVPVIQGQFTNWCPRKMIPIEEYCDQVDLNQPDFIAALVKQDICKPDTRSYDDLTPEQIEHYDLIKKEFTEGYKSKYLEIINRSCRYKSANLFNLNLLNGKTSDPKNGDRLFVYPCFIKPGRQYYVVRLDPADEKLAVDGLLGSQQSVDSDQIFSTSQFSQRQCKLPEYYAHSFTAPFRIERIPIFTKSYGSKRVDSCFKKNNSVFKDWIEDTELKLIQCCGHDFQFWKVNKFVKEPEEQTKCEQLIRKHVETLKAIQIYYASSSNFPYIQSFEFQGFLNKFGVLDKNLDKSAIDTHFIAGYANMGKLEGVIENMIIRLQFFEIIIRMANTKYRESGRVKLHSEALRMFIDKDIKPNCQDIIDQWSGFRKNTLWTMEVNELLKANLPGIQQLMEKYYQPRQKFLTMEDACRIFSTDSGLLIDTESRFIYGMSKMTNINETKEYKRHKQITNITEFLEMIGRAADSKFEAMTDIPFQEKVALVLDKILAIVNVKRKNPKVSEEQDQSESDEDY